MEEKACKESETCGQVSEELNRYEYLINGFNKLNLELEEVANGFLKAPEEGKPIGESEDKEELVPIARTLNNFNDGFQKTLSCLSVIIRRIET